MDILLRRSEMERGKDLPLSESQLQTLRIIAISAACLSLATGSVVGYWFVRMKRSFRHHLIMLLIFSDFWKATWQLTNPAVVFSGQEVESSDTFCQVSGFFMSFGIEASDFASVVIAIHSALYIFRPSSGFGDGGLFRYRYYVYILWMGFPLLMASLAFINKPYAYTAQETYCYLPAEPKWPRQALAWIPRYVFMLVIFVLYASVYIYVKLTFRTWRTNAGSSTLEMETVEFPAPEAGQPTPPPLQRPHGLHVHNLLPESSGSTPRQQSQRATQEKGYLAPEPAEARRSHHSFDHAFEFIFPRLQRSGSYPRGSVSSESGGQTQQSPSDSMADKEMQLRRLQISRQLRLLFIYPVVYVAMWLLPLISQALQNAGYFERNNAFPLRCLVAFTIPAQCAIDCWLFTIREQPWKSIPSRKRTFWDSFCFWQKSEQLPHATTSDITEWRKHYKGLSPASRRAYARREAEMKEAAERWLAKSRDLRSPPTSAGLPSFVSGDDRKEIAWWDRLEEQALEEGSGGRNPYSDAEMGYSPVSPISPVSPRAFTFDRRDSKVDCEGSGHGSSSDSNNGKGKDEERN